MKKLLIMILGLSLLAAGSALADQSVQLPGGHYSITLPDSMSYSAPRKDDRAQFAYISSNLEMDVFAYANEGKPLQMVAEEMQSSGVFVQIRNVAGIEMLCYRITDDSVGSDHALCIGYAFIDGNQVLELSFWYGTTEAGNQSTAIMESIR